MKCENGFFITLEGIDCCGKTTILKLLLKYLQEKERNVICSREPGGSFYGECLRMLIKHPEIAIPALFEAFTNHEDFPSLPALNDGFEERNTKTEILMFNTARSDFVSRVVLPELKKGKIFLLDRFFDSTTAYQGGGGFNLDQEKINEIEFINIMATNGLIPDLTLIIDISIEEMIKRRSLNSEQDAHFEKKYDLKYFERVRKAYLNIAEEEPERVVLINGEQSVEEVFEEVKQAIKRIGV